MKNVAIVGTGLMGTDIAFVAAAAGFEVYMYDIEKEHVASAMSTIQKRFSRYAATARIDAERAAGSVKRLHPCDTLDGITVGECVIESIEEDLGIKQAVFAELDRFCRPDAVLATNTSCISITEIASATRRPESVIGLHFMNPAHVMKLVEEHGLPHICKGICIGPIPA